MKKYTVIGYYDETGQTYIDTVEAEEAFQAMRIIAERRLDDLILVGAIEGDHEMIDPAESGTCFACDFPGGSDEDIDDSQPFCPDSTDGHDDEDLPGGGCRCRNCGREHGVDE